MISLLKMISSRCIFQAHCLDFKKLLQNFNMQYLLMTVTRNYRDHRYYSHNAQHGSLSFDSDQQKSSFSFPLTSENLSKLLYSQSCLQQTEELILQINQAMIFLLILSSHSQLDGIFQNIDSHNLPKHVKQSQLSIIPYVVIFHLAAKVLSRQIFLSFCDKEHCVSTFPLWLSSLSSFINYMQDKINNFLMLAFLLDKGVK